MSQPVDVCIFGAGPAASSVAARLSDLGVSVLLLDRPETANRWGGETMTGAIREPLVSLSEWNAFLAAGHVTSYARHVTWGGEHREESSVFQPQGSLWHVDRARFDDDLRWCVQQRGVASRHYRHLNEIRREDERWHLRLDRGREVSAKYLVDASGRSRVLARKLGQPIRHHDRLIALCARVERNPNQEFDHSMVIESTPLGWWYAAPVPQGHVLVFLTDADLAPAELKRSMWTVAANSAFAHTDDECGWISVGDACASHDPLCGWGVCRAMTNGLKAAEAIACLLQSGDRTPLHLFRRHCREQFEGYLVGLTDHYSAERRWPSAPFWARRMSQRALAS